MQARSPLTPPCGPPCGNCIDNSYVWAETLKKCMNWRHICYDDKNVRVETVDDTEHRDKYTQRFCKKLICVKK
jgi:hypothetical protein